MHLMVFVTVGIAVCGPALIDASERRIVFVVPRYVRRSYDETQFFEHREPAYKTRRTPVRPRINNQHYTNSGGPFYLSDEHRVPQGGDDFDRSVFAPHQRVRHVLIPHGEGITHGISFGKGYIPHEEFKGVNEEEYDFSVPGGNHLELGDLQMGNRGPGRVRFEGNGYDDNRFRGQEHNAVESENGPAEWAGFSHHREGGNYGLREEPQDQRYRSQTPTAASSNEEMFYPRFSQSQHGDNGEEVRAVPQGIPSGVDSPLAVIHERKPAPLIFQDTVDMKEYIEKVQAFARSWPHAASIQTFGWQNQIRDPQISNYNPGFDQWSAYLQPRNPGGGYQVQEESSEGSNRRHFRQIMT